MPRAAVLASVVAASVLAWLPAAAATGVCDSNPPTTTDACINAIQANGGVVNDIFKDSQGHTATQLPTYGQLFNVYPGCTIASCAGCDPGTDTAPYDCPGEYSCVSQPATGALFTDVAKALAGVDHVWAHPCRLSNHTLVNGCPQYTACIPDGTGGAYFPWEGLIFDLGGPSNQVAIFAMNDHGPQPCESLEYTVYLTNNPQSQSIVLHPTTTGADPNQWNRAVLSKVFTQGWYTTRAPDPAGHGTTCGDTTNYSVELDAFSQVFKLPCGISFRYAAVVAGNDGLDFPQCAYDSSEAELDAVAGLTESGAGVCPDKDGDGYVDCKCPGAPPLCDCDDSDPNTHPNAPEACDAPKDYNCNGHHPEPCPPGLDCWQSICIPPCAGQEFPCPAGSSCEAVDTGQNLCIPQDCTVGGCPPGATCDPKSKTCVPDCAGVVCPAGQKCEGGQCVDLCAQIQCPNGWYCSQGACLPPCSCFQGDVGCGDAGTACDRPQEGGGGTNQCVPPSCVGVVCPPAQHCANGACVDLCSGVTCPPQEVCLPSSGTDSGTPSGCVNLCAGGSCPAGQACDWHDGQCKPTGGNDSGTFGAPDGGSDATTGGGSHDATTGGGGDATTGGGDSGSGNGDTAGNGSKSGCGCDVVGDGPGSALAALGALGGLLALGARRRRR